MLSPEEIRKITIDPETNWIPAWKWVTEERKPICTDGHLNLFGPFPYDSILAAAEKITYNDNTLIIPDGFDDDYQSGFEVDCLLLGDQTLGTPHRDVMCSKGIHSQPQPTMYNFHQPTYHKITLAIPVEFTISGGWFGRSGDGEKYRSACAWVLGDSSLCF